MTSIAHQDLDSLGGPLSILARQRRDHERLDRLLGRLEAAAPGAEEAQVLRHTARLVFPHAFAEESVLWPELRRRLPDGDTLTLTVEEEHQEVNQLWTTLESLPPTGAERREVRERLVEVLREDVRDEEDVLLPRLQEAVGVGRLRTLGVVWEVVRRTAPTRPHPVVSRRPPRQRRGGAAAHRRRSQPRRAGRRRAAVAAPRRPGLTRERRPGLGGGTRGAPGAAATR